MFRIIFEAPTLSSISVSPHPISAFQIFTKTLKVSSAYWPCDFFKNWLFYASSFRSALIYWHTHAHRPFSKIFFETKKEINQLEIRCQNFWLNAIFSLSMVKGNVDKNNLNHFFQISFLSSGKHRNFFLLASRITEQNVFPRVL